MIIGEIKEATMDIRENILEDLKKVAPKRRIKLTSELDFDYAEKTLTITIHGKGVGYGYVDSKGKVKFLNMQDDGAAFEGWAIILRTYWNKNEQYRVKFGFYHIIIGGQCLIMKDHHEDISPYAYISLYNKDKNDFSHEIDFFLYIKDKQYMRETLNYILTQGIWNYFEKIKYNFQ